MMMLCPAGTFMAPETGANPAITDWFIAADVLGAKVASPLYLAEMGCTATLDKDGLNVATAAELNGALPIETPLSRKVTMPVGWPPAVAVTVAVNVTGCPPVDVLDDEASAVEVERLIVWESALEVLAGKVASPE
jgi:hypothetical protein